MSRLKLMTIIGTRPEIIRLSACFKAFDEAFEHTLVHTGQNYDYGLNGIFFEQMGLRAPDHSLEAAGGDLGETIGNIISGSYKLIKSVSPDALLILGDTNSALSAISAKRLHVPVFHMEAGNRCFDQNVSEELNRRIVDHIADVNLPYTERARQNLLAEGIPGEYIFVTGSPMPEVLGMFAPQIESSAILKTMGLKSGEYILFSSHREENMENEANFFSLVGTANGVAARTGLPVVWPAHPRSAKMIKEKGCELGPLVRVVPPLGFFDFVCLQKNAYCVLSDSGTLAEESAVLGFPAVSIRTSTERPEAVEAGTMIMGGVSGPGILRAAELAVGAFKKGRRPAPPADYLRTDVSARVTGIIQGYTGVVNKRVWNKGGA